MTPEVAGQREGRMLMKGERPPLPTFLIVGAMKSGTSTLAAHLREHPEIFMPRQELHYFDQDPDPRGNLEEYRSLFKDWSGEPEVGEKTPNYSLMPEGAELLADTLGDIKLIWCFRDPVERTYSNYWHAVKRGREFRSFEAAVRREFERIRPGQDHPYRKFGRCYVRRSHYVEQLERFREHFDDAQMHYLLLEDLKEHPQKSVQDVMGFLGVDPELRTPPDLHRHKTYVPRSPMAQYIARALLGDGGSFKRVARINRRKAPGYPPMEKRTWRLLSEHFQEWYREFERLTGMSTKRWRSATV